MDRNLALEILRVTEGAALAAARWVGRGDETAADIAAVDAMHRLFAHVGCTGRIVVGEGDEDTVPRLYVGETVGNRQGPQVEIVLDALEGAVTCATGASNAIAAIALSEYGELLRCPKSVYMEKIAVGPTGYGVVDLDRPVVENLRALADAKGVPVQNLTVVVLDRPRHETLIGELRDAGVRVRLFLAGDLPAALATSHEPSGIDLLMGTGRAAQGILAAAALRCVGGQMQARFRPNGSEEAEQLREVGIHDSHRKFTESELAPGNVVFAATGVTSGDYLGGVRFYKGGAVSHSVVMRSKTGTIRFMDTYHHFEGQPEY